MCGREGVGLGNTEEGQVGLVLTRAGTTGAEKPDRGLPCVWPRGAAGGGFCWARNPGGAASVWGHITFPSTSVEQTRREGLLCTWLQAAFAFRALGELRHFHSLLHEAASRAFQARGFWPRHLQVGSLRPPSPQTFSPRNPQCKRAQRPE